MPKKTRPKPAPGTQVALLRGINVGGKNKLAMKDLVALFEAAGARDVRTHIQSGNVIFTASAAAARRAAKQVEAALARRGLRSPVVLRSAAELAAAVANNPLARDADPASLHVAFLSKKPKAAAVAKLDPLRSPPDRFVVRGRDIYLCCPNGVARSKLTNDYFDRSLGVVSTLRNWRTLSKLIELSSQS